VSVKEENEVILDRHNGGNLYNGVLQKGRILWKLKIGAHTLEQSYAIEFFQKGNDTG
jgi:hypothetical protein